MSDASPFNYCTRCGDELTEREAEVAGDSDTPPLCTTCVVEVTQGLIRPIAEMYANFATAINEAFRPLVEAIESVEADRGGSDER